MGAAGDDAATMGWTARSKAARNFSAPFRRFSPGNTRVCTEVVKRSSQDGPTHKRSEDLAACRTEDQNDKAFRRLLPPRFGV